MPTVRNACLVAACLATFPLSPGAQSTEVERASRGRMAARSVAGAAIVMARADAVAAEPDLTELRRLTERFRDVNVALAEGYMRDPMNSCETADMMGRPASLGAMGIHYVKMELLGITGPPNPRVNGSGIHTDFARPAVLLYEPQKDGSLELVAVENLVFKAAWEQAGHKAPPSYLGVPWDDMVDDPATEVDEAHMFEPHYDRHVWIFRENPSGMFAQFNPRVSCEHHPRATHKH